MGWSSTTPARLGRSFAITQPNHCLLCLFVPMTFTCSHGSQMRWLGVMQNSQCTHIIPDPFSPFFPSYSGRQCGTQVTGIYPIIETICFNSRKIAHHLSFRSMMSDKFLHAMLLIPNSHLPVSHPTLIFHDRENEAQPGERTTVMWLWRMGSRSQRPMAPPVTESCHFDFGSVKDRLVGGQRKKWDMTLLYSIQATSTGRCLSPIHT